MTTNNNSTAAYAGGGALFGILMANVLSDILSGQPYWLRIVISALAGGALAAIFVLVANRFTRR